MTTDRLRAYRQRFFVEDSLLGNTESAQMASSAAIRRRMLLFRHGEVRYQGADNQPLPPETVTLTASGMAQLQTYQPLWPAELPSVFCSPLPRCRHSAQLITGAEESELTVLDNLHEVHHGRLNRGLADPYMAYGTIMQSQTPHHRFGPGHEGEYLGDAYTRVTQTVEGIFLNHHAPCFVVVAHEIVNRLLLCWALGGDFSALDALDVGFGALCVIDCDIAADGIAAKKIRLMNYTPWHQPLQETPSNTSLESIFLPLAYWLDVHGDSC